MTFFISFALLGALVFAVGVVERLPAFRFRPIPVRRPYLGTDAGWFLVAATASGITAFVFRPQLAKLAIEPLSGWVGELPAATRLLLAVVIFDLISFAVHLALHRSDVLWSFHKVHHSSLQLDGLATTRAHMFENLIRFITPQAVLFLIGMPIEQVTPAVAIYAVYGVFNHSNLGIDLRWAEAVFITPRVHRRHHVPSTSQNNFGTILSIWDRMLGRLVTVDTTPDERFGVPGEVDSYPQRFGPAVREPIIQVRRTRDGRRSARNAGATDRARANEEVAAR